MNFGDFSKNSFSDGENSLKKLQNISPKNSKNPETEELSVVTSLESLLQNMKPSFLPREENSRLLRQVFLSKNFSSPMILLRRDMTTILIGSPNGNLEIAGKNYPILPDLRLVFSEKSRLRAWILLDTNFDTQYIVDIATVLDFPQIFSTRNIIAKICNSEIDKKILEKFRFVEIFSQENISRNIDGIELFIAKNGNKNILGFQNEWVRFGYDFLTIDNISTNISTEQVFVEQSGKFLLGNTEIMSWEILEIFGEKISKNSMKFVLDTFFIDKKSVGTTSGFILQDRENLSGNGVLIFTIEENEMLHTISGHIFIDSRGFVHAHEVMKIHKEILKAIRIIYEQTREQNPNIERWQLVQILRKEVGKYAFLLTGRTPIVMPIIITKN